MKRWLKVLLFGDSFFMLSMGMITPIYAIFVERIGGDILDASGAWAAFALSSGVLMYILGRWEDRHKHFASLACLGYLLRSLAFLGYFFVENTLGLFIVQIVLGVSGAINTPAIDTLYTRYLDGKKQASEWAAWEGLDLVISAFAAIIGGTIATYLGFRVLFLAMFASGIIGTAISVQLMSPSAIKASKRK